MIEDLLIVIVLYKIRLKDSLTFQTLLKNSNTQLSIYVYDNSPADYKEEIFYDDIEIEYINDHNNSGISKAYNLAAEYAHKKNKKWLLLLDQDSYLASDFFSKINDSLFMYPDQSLFVPVLKHGNLILSPCKFRFMKGSALKKIPEGIFSLRGHSVFNSGIVIRLFDFDRAGGYNENIPLDFSDHSFISRFKKLNENIVVMPVLIEHELSSQSDDEEVVFRRFRQYCFGVKKYSEEESGGNLLIFWTLLRAVKLTLQFKEVKFLSVFLKKK